MIEVPYRHGFPMLEVRVKLPAEVVAEKMQSGLSLSPPEKGWALIDTGSDTSCFDLQAAGKIGLLPTGQENLLRHAVEGSYKVPTFDGELEVPDFKLLRVREARGLSLSRFGLVALVGRDFLDGLTLCCDGSHVRLSLN